MTSAVIALAGLGLAVLLTVGLIRLIKAATQYRARRQMRTEALLTELYLQRLTHQAMARLLDDAREALLRASRPQ